MAQGLTLNQLTATTFTNTSDLLMIYQTGSTLSISVGNLTKNNVFGSGTLNYIPKWSGTTGITNSTIFDNGATVWVGYNNLLTSFRVSANTFNIGKGGSGTSRALFMGKSIPSTWTGSSICGQFDFNNPEGDQGVVIRTNAGYVGTGSTPVAGGIISVQGGARGIIFAGNSVDENHLVIDSFGKVGIGTNIPTKTLTVSGDSNFIGDITSTGIIFCTDVIASESLQGNEIFPSEDVDLNISTRTDTGTKEINLMTGPKPGGLGYVRMKITSGGTIGVNTESPNALFDISSPTGTTVGLRVLGNSDADMVRITQTGSGNAFVVEDSSNPDSTPFVITSGGTVGIGVTNPNPFTLNQSDGKLHVRSGNSGVTGGTGGSTVVIEASTTNYLSMYSPNENVSGIVFGSNSDAFGSFIRWGRDQGKLQIATANANDYIEFGVGNYLFNSYITNSGFGINTLPTHTFHVSGNTLIEGDIIYPSPSTPPVSSGSTGTKGTITWDSNYFYICVNTNTWKRVQLLSW
jgi:hypothetical protein